MRDGASCHLLLSKSPELRIGNPRSALILARRSIRRFRSLKRLGLAVKCHFLNQLIQYYVVVYSSCSSPAINLATFAFILLHLIEEHIDFFLHAQHIASLTLLDFIIANAPPAISWPLLPF